MTQKMFKLAEFPVEEILPLIGEERHRFIFNDVSFNVRLNSTRLLTFKKNLSCVTCGLTGTMFRLEVHLPEWLKPSKILSEVSRHGACYVKDCARCRPIFKSIGTPHLNLYAPGDQEPWVLMTQDHIMPKSRGGPNVLRNLQTMCYACNHAKGSTISEGYVDSKALPSACTGLDNSITQF